jgi:adenylate cyclase
VSALRSAIIDPAIEARGGRLVKTMGDGFLLEFASAVDAVECAVEVQDRVAEMSGETKAAQSIELRIGVNVGDIMVEDGDVFGDGVNVAARLVGLADPGEFSCRKPLMTRCATESNMPLTILANDR